MHNNNTWVTILSKKKGWYTFQIIDTIEILYQNEKNVSVFVLGKDNLFVASLNLHSCVDDETQEFYSILIKDV